MQEPTEKPPLLQQVCFGQWAGMSQASPLTNQLFWYIGRLYYLNARHISFVLVFN